MDSAEHSFTATNKIPSQTIQMINCRLERQELKTLSFVVKLLKSVHMPLFESCWRTASLENEKRYHDSSKS